MGKALIPVKAQAMDVEELSAWFDGRTSRRLLAIPFGGPIPSPKSPRGVDLDNEWFDESTDIYGTVKGLRETRERLVDWHHGHDPTGVMKRTIIAKSLLDEEPDEAGYWSTVWIKLGEKRVELVRRLAERGAELFGSSEAAYKKADPDGRITEWPMILQTLTTTPQNTYSVLRAAKARELAELNDSVDPALLRVLDDLSLLGTNLSASGDFRETMAKTGRLLSGSLEPWETLLADKRR